MRPSRTTSRKAEQSAATLERVFAASMDLFSHRGIHSTSMDQIARRARLTKGAIYWHFRSKDHLLDGILQRIKEDWQRVVLHRLAVGTSPMDKVERLFVSYQELLSEEPEICLFLQRAMMEPNASLNRKVNQVFDQTANVIAAVFDEGKDAGVFAYDVDSRVLAFSVLSSFAGAVMHRHSDKTLRFAELIAEIKRQTLARLGGAARTAVRPSTRAPSAAASLASTGAAREGRVKGLGRRT